MNKLSGVPLAGGVFLVNGPELPAKFSPDPVLDNVASVPDQKCLFPMSQVAPCQSGSHCT